MPAVGEAEADAASGPGVWDGVGVGVGVGVWVGVGVDVGTVLGVVGAAVGEGVGEAEGDTDGDTDGDAEGEGDGDGLVPGPGEVVGSSAGGVAPGPGCGVWSWRPKGSQLRPEPAKGSQVGEEPLNQTRVPGPRPKMKTTTVRAASSATTEDAILRRNAGRVVHTVPYDALTALPLSLLVGRLLPPD